MTVRVYGFDEKLAQGEAGERYLDSLWSDRWTVGKAGKDDQRRGIDRWLINRENGRRVAVEYKTDTTAGRTGNAFVETVSVSTTGKAGWAKSSEATLLVYYIPEPQTVYCIPMQRIRDKLAEWSAKYPTRDVPNQGYVTTGLLVPLDEFERLAKWVL